jgi:hypothetical protein
MRLVVVVVVGCAGNRYQKYKILKMKLEHFIDKHEGETMYVLASGPELARLPKDYLEYVGTANTISMNHSFMVLPYNWSRYWITGHWSMIFLMEELGNASTDRFFVRRKYRSKPYPGFINVGRMPYKNGFLPKGPAEHLVSVKNVTFAALHLAYVMGAKKIVIHGLEMLDGTHFWNYNKRIEEDLRRAMLKLIDHHLVNNFARTELINSYKTIFDKAYLKKISYSSRDLTRQYQSIISTLIKHGVDVCYTTDKGILTKTKARKVELWEM